ncbi:MAG: glutamine-hydrolyzing carbamoyl-phosphate synthase small subunit [Actinomycetota bacterium]
MSKAILALEDGASFAGESFGATGETFGEVVFNTSLTGYQEVLTDPSYAGQIVCMTYPHIGSYGVNEQDVESSKVQVAGFAVRDAVREYSSWRATSSVHDYLEASSIVGIEGIDTRALTRHIRSLGAMRGAISTEDLDASSLVERVRRSPSMEGLNLAEVVSTKEPYRSPFEPGRKTFKVAAYDYGIKTNILRLLAEHDCEVTVFPAVAPASELSDFDGVFLSNGPGDPAAVKAAIQSTRALLGSKPIFGICLGHQILGLALGGKTYKLKFGHRGVNQPVRRQQTGAIEITSHNHGFAVDAKSFSSNNDGTLRTTHGAAVISHINLNDDTCEGLRCLEIPAFSVQYHPEAAPGPHDARYLFKEFVKLMEGVREPHA